LHGVINIQLRFGAVGGRGLRIEIRIIHNSEIPYFRKNSTLKNLREGGNFTGPARHCAGED
jgi:hypothetical protein